MAITIRDIAAAAGVNASTVSRALRNDPRITREIREKICLLAEELCYVPNRSARQLAGGRTELVVVATGLLDNELSIQATDALQKELDDYGYMAVLLPNSNNGQGFVRMLRMCEQHFCDAAVLYSPQNIPDDMPEIRLLLDKNFPFVCMDQWLDNYPFPAITNDAEKSIEALGERMCNCGMNAALIWFPEKNSVASFRKREAEKFMAENNIRSMTSLDELKIFLKTHPGTRLGVMADSPLLPELDAVIGNSAEMCIGGMFDSWKFNAPKCFDRIFLCQQDMSLTGKTAGEYIIRMLRGEKNMPRVTMIPPEEILTPYLK